VFFVRGFCLFWDMREKGLGNWKVGLRGVGWMAVNFWIGGWGGDVEQCGGVRRVSKVKC
jgi:hypothetical protein